MENKPLSVSSAVKATQPVDELFDILSAAPVQIHCRNCGTKLLHIQTTFFSDSGKLWTLALPLCTNCEPLQATPECSDSTPLRRKRNFMMQFEKVLYSGPSLRKALPVSTPSGPTWEQLYKQAISEFDPSKLLERIADARRAIVNRAKEILTCAPGNEQRALDSAVKTLRVLEEVAARERLAA